MITLSMTQSISCFVDTYGIGFIVEIRQKQVFACHFIHSSDDILIRVAHSSQVLNLLFEIMGYGDCGCHNFHKTNGIYECFGLRDISKFWLKKKVMGQLHKLGWKEGVTLLEPVIQADAAGVTLVYRPKVEE